MIPQFILPPNIPLKADTEATTSNSCLKNFARNLIKDYDAVNNAVVTPYSNGRLKVRLIALKILKEGCMAEQVSLYLGKWC